MVLSQFALYLHRSGPPDSYQKPTGRLGPKQVASELVDRTITTITSQIFRIAFCCESDIMVFAVIYWDGVRTMLSPALTASTARHDF